MCAICRNPFIIFLSRTKIMSPKVLLLMDEGVNIVPHVLMELKPIWVWGGGTIPVTCVYNTCAICSEFLYGLVY